MTAKIKRTGTSSGGRVGKPVGVVHGGSHGPATKIKC